MGTLSWLSVTMTMMMVELPIAGISWGRCSWQKPQSEDTLVVLKRSDNSFRSPTCPT
ncbi:hypothetical protein B0H10DRAFT_2015388 [Mycena sp. CBHHK59/15]|nr:hypothetical protein B0H10DRAFT_2039086 [Mycena sp. CBHHK59/15]KAJ6621942.1 hypothetical protein B0H10DRAFT_2015388 [Mycena sp. CBHHK59/15]